MEREMGRGVVRQRSQLKRAKNLCACAIDRTRLMEQLGLRGDPLLPFSLLLLLFLLLSSASSPHTSIRVSTSSLANWVCKFLLAADCGFFSRLSRLWLQLQTLSSVLASSPSPSSLPLSAAILAWLNLFNLLRRRRRLLKASATHNNFSHSVGDAARSPQLASNNSNNNKKNEATTTTTTTTTTGYWLTYPKSAFIKAPKRAGCSGWGDALMNEKAPSALAA